jgi:excisionase family DNA binding protein
MQRVESTVSEQQVLTPAQAARLLGLGKTTVIDWCGRGILPSIRIGTRWWLRRADLIRDGWLVVGGHPPRPRDVAETERTRAAGGSAARET